MTSRFSRFSLSTGPDLCPDRCRVPGAESVHSAMRWLSKGYLQEPEGLGTVGFPCCEKHEKYIGIDLLQECHLPNL